MKSRILAQCVYALAAVWIGFSLQFGLWRVTTVTFRQILQEEFRNDPNTVNRIQNEYSGRFNRPTSMILIPYIPLVVSLYFNIFHNRPLDHDDDDLVEDW